MEIVFYLYFSKQTGFIFLQPFMPLGGNSSVFTFTDFLLLVHLTHLCMLLPHHTAASCIPFIPVQQFSLQLKKIFLDLFSI